VKMHAMIETRGWGDSARVNVLELRILLHMYGICIVVRAPSRFIAGSGCMYEYVWNNRGGLMRMIAQEDPKGIIRWAFGGGFRVVSVR